VRFGLAAALIVAGCGGGETGTGGGGTGGKGGTAPYPDPTPLMPLSRAPLTTEERKMPLKAQEAGALDPRKPDDVATLLAQGYGDEMVVAGEPVADRTLDNMPAPAPGPKAKLIARFVHLSDIQLADDESPTRVPALDSPQGQTSGAFRPQEGHECNIMNAAVRTIDKLHETSPIDFVILGGDNADNAQTNEVDWATAILSGSKRVECDSGDDDDPVAGPENDPKDPFAAPGLSMPWVWVNGNHDVLNQGNFPPGPMANDYVSGYSGTGTRDWSEPGGPIRTGDVPADPKRAPLLGGDLLSHVLADGDGHGIDQAAVAYGRGYYTFDVKNTPLRFVVVDSTAPTGSADGLILQGDVAQMVKPALDKALADAKLVVVTSHHSSAQLTDGGGFGGTKHADALTADAWRNLLGGYPNVLMHLAGHTHRHSVVVVKPTSGNPYWEVETAALADFPNQMRFIEIWDLDNGNWGIKAIALDYQVENDPIATEGRKLGIADYTSGWQKSGLSSIEDRNVNLLVPKN
jgi:3',5'-cyclic AMP phosphodiesterase CpdA